jgi:maleylacetate reductase
MQSFTYIGQPSRIVFGSGTVGAVGDEVSRLGADRVLLLAGPRLESLAAVLTAQLGSRVAARFDGAAMHTPLDVTTRAMEMAEAADIDCVVAIGGGSATGLSKALAVRGGYDQIIVPTTYAGSEVTPVLGETVDGVKTTRSSPAILPETVIYDVDLSLDLPAAITLTSSINALAHAVEALYSAQRNPVTDLMALEAVTSITRALPLVMADLRDAEARSDLLRAAWLAGTCLGSVGMGLHHKLCHTLGGSFGLPHAQTHTVVLPHAMAYNAPAAHDVMERIAEAMGVPDAASGVYDLVARLGGPISLAELGFDAESIPRASELATAKPYPNPRPVTPTGIGELLTAATAGHRPIPGP